jgi:hypothetical protein
MLTTVRHSAEDGGIPVVLVTMLSCLAVLYWRITLLVLLILAVTALVYGVLVLSSRPG